MQPAGCSGVSPADDPVQGLRADVQSGFDIRVVQVEGEGGGVGAGRVQADRQVARRQTSQRLQRESHRKLSPSARLAGVLNTEAFIRT